MVKRGSCGKVLTYPSKLSLMLNEVEIAVMFNFMTKT